MSAGLLTSLVLLGGLSAVHPAVDRCRSLEADFDYRGVVSSCSITMADPSLSSSERAEVARLLAFAHVALGDESAAQQWFVQVLVLEPEYRPDAQVSPRFRDAFQLSLQRVEREGALRLTEEAPPEPPGDDLPLRRAFTLIDPLRRVAQAELVLDATTPGGATTRLPLRNEALEEANTSRLVTEVGPEHFTVEDDGTRVLRYRVVLLAPSGTELPTSPPFAPVDFTLAPSTSPPWLWSGLALAGSVAVVAAAAGGVALYCALGNCEAPPAGSPDAVVRVSVEGALGALP